MAEPRYSIVPTQPNQPARQGTDELDRALTLAGGGYEIYDNEKGEFVEWTDDQRDEAIVRYVAKVGGVEKAPKVPKGVEPCPTCGGFGEPRCVDVAHPGVS